MALTTIQPGILSPDLVLDDTPIRVNDNSIDVDITIPSNQNAFVAGPVTINSTITINGTLTVI